MRAIAVGKRPHFLFLTTLRLLLKSGTSNKGLLSPGKIYQDSICMKPQPKIVIANLTIYLYYPFYHVIPISDTGKHRDRG